jgi:putative sterol carrier protein
LGTVAEEITVKQIVEENIPRQFNPEAAKGEQAIIQVTITGDDAGDWYISVDDGSCEVKQGIHENPDASIRMKDKDYIAMNTGKLNAIMAVTFGKLKYAGNMTVLFKMQKWFPI